MRRLVLVFDRRCHARGCLMRYSISSSVGSRLVGFMMRSVLEPTRKARRLGPPRHKDAVSVAHVEPLSGMSSPEPYLKPIPKIDRTDGKRQPGPLFCRKCSLNQRPIIVGSASLREVGQRFRPGESSTLARGVKRCLTPPRQQIEAHGLFPVFGGFCGVQMNAEHTRIDLRART